MRLLISTVPILVLSYLVAASSHATPPMLDSLEVDGEEGAFHPSKCCWVDLPSAATLLEARRSERCSAIGGPVGRFRLRDGQIWLIGLRRCGGDIPIRAIYPELDDPAPATWLNGHFSASFGPVCYNLHDQAVGHTGVKLEVKDGQVVEIHREKIDQSSCRR